MKVITVRAPWPLAIAAGVKPVENRGRPTRHRGPIAIHSGATWSTEGAHDVRILSWWYGPEKAAFARSLEPADFAHTFRRVLAVADLVDCHPAAGNCCGDWGDERYGDGPAFHLCLRNVRRLADPPLAAGKVMVPWTLHEHQAAEVLRQVLDA